MHHAASSTNEVSSSNPLSYQRWHQRWYPLWNLSPQNDAHLRRPQMEPRELVEVRAAGAREPSEAVAHGGVRRGR